MRDKKKYHLNQSVEEVDEIYRRLSVAQGRISELEQNLAKRQVPGYWRVPVFTNGFAQPDPPVEPFAYRVYTGNLPEFKGHLDATNATSGSVAFTLTIGVNDVILPGDVFRPTIITDGTTFTTAMIKIDSVTGEVTITWPAN